MPIREERGAEALRLRQMGYQIVPCKEGEKGLAFRGASPLSLDGIVKLWADEDFNIGVHLAGTGIAVIDVDDEEAEAFVSEHGLQSNTVVLTPSGGRHLYMRHSIEEVRTRIRFQGLPLDIKTTGHVMAGGSVFEGKTYRYERGPRHPKLLPTLPDRLQKLIRADLRKVATPAPLPPLPRLEGHDASSAENYVDTFNIAVQGQGGSAVCIKAMLKILTRVRGDLTRAWILAVRYSRRCDPPWDEEAEEGPNSLKKKLRDAASMWHQR